MLLWILIHRYLRGDCFQLSRISTEEQNYSILRNCQVVFSKVVVQFIIPLVMQETSKISTFLLRLGGHFKLRHPRRCGFDLIFLMINNEEHLFMCLLTICVSSWENIYLNPSLYSNWVVCFVVDFKSFYIPVTRPLSNIWPKYFLRFLFNCTTWHIHLLI